MTNRMTSFARRTGRNGLNRKGNLRKRVAAILCAAGVVLTGFMGAAPANAAGASGPCDFAVFIGVRGTGAPGGSNVIHSGRVWASGGMGDQISALAGKESAAPYPVYFESLVYPASTDLTNSVAAGSATLINELNYLSTVCGSYAPAVVIAGHSQGASVIESALGNGQWPQGPTLTDRAKSMIKAVTMFGNPGFFPGDVYNAPYSPGGTGLFPRNQVVYNNLTGYRFWGWSQGSTIQNPSWQPRIRSYCASGDFFCQNNPGDSNYAIHNSYKTTTMSFADSWIHYMLTSTN